MTIGLVGATGLVGQTILQVLAERSFPLAGLRLWASSRSDGRRIKFKGKNYPVASVERADFSGCGVVFFAGTEGEKGASRRYAQKAIAAGAVVIDNGSDFRMDPKIPLIVPEVNPQDVKKHQGLIANPNCSTIQMVVALAPIYKKYRVRRIVVSTYQAVSGAGRGGAKTLEDEIKNQKSKIKNQIFARQIAFNVIPQISDFSQLGYSGEEWKMVRETQKILHDKNIAVNATTVRVPVLTGHSESVYFETGKNCTLKQIEQLLAKAPGVVFNNKDYITPAELKDSDLTYVGRLRPDPFKKNAFVMWVVADNLRKGAATNAVQIAELLLKLKIKDKI
ncbi:MAG: aspartate-semialdehyde dehydrogenase [Candidatus Edwardsbacteria bacterium RIFOXYD12_FULL_50_11]|uniref:Aspartate-semialdehyde dehydrogenase n=1 Tax=Candidatus Edwardsbacteria bacterium GWF2_54_11 TaxID=1817851 RepID=A0A1F5RFR9_9BACT|nr:MAG: aspartate-semialdehyde dehydrogenase [Candidatus Edwardsbacteria bacterium RifOxyC12_full_54_24]OGF06961.1 MAG: aspartate-semialdehyde dehydrogenase [Candidatus Edwardsbacteria bacterium RifOxyA12_full_54_48]OGF11098.1 MAG: aspartate-semialdehyde dehydrogenase [Candidatus Edwardsbacteria bacterium GWE2_54_12]OGF13242.1 MAG: aspartate-semialdehyde dehydrogenase [Candidatus Edwardsbacteria bacterium GWF2_54_11]OGF14747.1 MAG: aspartate-semialdehyde dehydrogenase [Candidatus Edwardsbacteri